MVKLRRQHCLSRVDAGHVMNFNKYGLPIEGQFTGFTVSQP